jgi:hypothetical protein
MQVGIDWVSAAIFGVAFLISQIRAVPVRGRYSVLSLACGAIGGYRLRLGAAGPNMVFVGIAFALAVYYAFRAIRPGPRPE